MLESRRVIDGVGRMPGEQFGKEIAIADVTQNGDERDFSRNRLQLRMAFMKAALCQVKKDEAPRFVANNCLGQPTADETARPCHKNRLTRVIPRTENLPQGWATQ